LTGGNSTNYVGDVSNTNILAADAVFENSQTDYRIARSIHSLSISFLDSPNTTSEVTYQVQIRGRSGENVHVNRPGLAQTTNRNARTASSIIVMEIAG
jgi:hypothetical protein